MGSQPDYTYTDQFGDSLHIFKAGDQLVIAVECLDRGLGDGSPCISVDADILIAAVSALRAT